jgi:hypothetical protein
MIKDPFQDFLSQLGKLLEMPRQKAIDHRNERTRKRKRPASAKPSSIESSTQFNLPKSYHQASLSTTITDNPRFSIPKNNPLTIVSPITPQNKRNISDNSVASSFAISSDDSPAGPMNKPEQEV